MSGINGLKKAGSNYITNHFSTYWGLHQRLILGVSALPTQPVIDYFNPHVDKKTQKYSTARTIVKIIVGTAVGVSVRAICKSGSLKLINKYLIDVYNQGLRTFKENNPAKRTLKEILNEKLPENLHEFAEKSAKSPAYSDNFAGQIGTLLGVIVSLATNFLIDMPLTKSGTNYLVQKYKLDATEKK